MLPTDDQLIAKSPVIVEATVISSAAVAHGSEIWTETKLTVDRSHKGNAFGEITVREAGGILDDRITRVFGTPDYAAGERVLVFLTPRADGTYQTTDLYVGKFSEDRALNGRRLWMRDNATANVTLLDSRFRPIVAKNVQRDGDGFDTYVANRIRGKAADGNYGIENPLLASDVPAKRTGPQLPITGDFTLISEPTIYRWKRFDSGQGAAWVSSGTQPGYNGGGSSEVQTAMSPWNNCPGARIIYSYSGSTTATPGGLSGPNGVNEILFNDPKSEISGSWNPSTGGVVGQGGFNGVRNGGSWTSTFAADASHPQQTYSSFEIVEGNLTIQDNVSSTTGISSTRLAEIVAHEFGHTLGFGHSAESNALMFATVTGLGPSLRADDQLAAQWLYPNGSATPTPNPSAPGAPGALTATSSGSTISLQWTRNSTNESGFYVYVSYNNAPFTKVTGSFGSGTSSGNLTSAASGSYRIYITAYNTAGESAASNTASVTVSSSTPPAGVTAYFTMSPSSGIANQTQFQFTDQSSGNITTRTWSFGDGTTATSGTNQTHVYTSAGSYVVVLNVTNGTATATYSAGVSVSGQSPGVPLVVADFSMTPSSPAVGSEVSFTNNSTGGPVSFSWNFGDGATSTAQNPTHRYNGQGTYTVTLVASNGFSSASKNRTISVVQNDRLLLNNSRYSVTISARDQRSGITAKGIANMQTDVFGYFSLPELTGNPNNPEVFVKVLGPVNGVPWVFFGGLTDVEYTLTVTDTINGQVRTYHHAPGDSKGGYDTGGGQGPAGACVASTIEDGRSSLTRATATASQLALLNNRFGLTLIARDPRTGASTSGITIAKTEEFGFYTLPGLTGDPNNIEVFTKIVDATKLDGHFWVFFGGLTDFEYTLTVTDTTSGKVRSYTKPAGSACGGFDTTRF